MKYQEALEYIHGTYQFGSKLGLENIRYLLNLLGNPHKSLKVIHVAGTNGKGSTSSFIHSILKSSGYKVGLYTSPYLEEFTERIRINGENIPKERLAEITATVKEKIETMVSEGKNYPTEFEVVTAIAFTYYAQEEVDFVVLEVGLGGRLDATNVVENPLVSAITTIGYDHMQYLGDSLDKIAFEKGGIIKGNSFVVTSFQEKVVMKVLEEICSERNSKLFSFDPDHNVQIQYSGIDEQQFTVNMLGKEYKNLKIQMVGIHQIYNCCTALMTIEILRKYHQISIDDEAIYQGVYMAKWPGRFEVLKSRPITIIDGAHNLHGAEALRKTVEKLLKEYKITFVVGVLQDKDVRGILDSLIPLMDQVIATKPDNPRAMDAEELAKKLAIYDKRVYVCNDIHQAVKKAFEVTDSSQTILFAGSLYMIGEVRKFLKTI